MKLIKNYLTSEEIAEIVTVLVSEENAITREILKIGVLTQILIDGIGEKETCDEYADLYFAQDDIDFARDIRNYDVIDKIVDKELGIEKAVKDFLDELNVKLDTWGKGIGEINQEQLLGQMKELIGSASL